jgi:hypothetical protein
MTNMFLFRVDEANEAHVFVRVFAGQSGQRGLCGSLTFRRYEWERFVEMIGDRAEFDISAVSDESPGW